MPFLFAKFRAFWISLTVIVVMGIGAYWMSRESLPRKVSVELPTVPSEGRPGGFVTSNECRECHAAEYKSWHRSYHRTMTQYAVEEAVQADFDNVKLQFNDDLFRLEKRSGQFLANVSDTSVTSSGSVVGEETVVPVRMVTGSHHMQVFWLEGGHGNLMLGFPFTWLNAEKQWVPRADTFLRDPQLPPPVEVWNETCIRCHTTAGQSRKHGQEQVFRTRSAELGIACEACHGPGDAHVKERRAEGGTKAQRKKLKPGEPTPIGASSIIHPANLDPVRSSQICGNCHGMKWFEANEDWNENGFHFRPGDDLEKFTPTIRPTQIAKQPWLKPVLEKHAEIMSDFFWPDGMVRVSGREFNGLVESACFERGKMSCLSCHSMHESEPVDQLAAKMEGNNACLQCHEKFRTQLVSHTRHGDQSSGSQCYNCHMPHTTYGLLKAMRSHQITSPSVSRDAAAGRPNACNLCHLDRSLGWAATQLTGWYGQKPVALTEDQKTVPAGALWLLQGDAGERALAAWHLGWAPAREVSTNLPFAALLGLTLDDPYSAVRFVAQRSLRSDPTYTQFPYDYVGDPSIRATSAESFWAVLSRQPRSLTVEMVRRLKNSQNSRPVHLRE